MEGQAAVSKRIVSRSIVNVDEAIRYERNPKGIRKNPEHHNDGDSDLDNSSVVPQEDGSIQRNLLRIALDRLGEDTCRSSDRQALRAPAPWERTPGLETLGVPSLRAWAPPSHPAPLDPWSFPSSPSAARLRSTDGMHI